MKKLFLSWCLLTFCSLTVRGQGFDVYGGALGSAQGCTWPNANLSASISSISQAGTTTVTVVLSQPLNLWVGETIFVTGTTHFNNTTAPAQLVTASVTDQTHFTYTNTTSQTFTDNAGTIVKARWYFQKLTDVNGTPRWFYCTPLGNPKINITISSVTYSNQNVHWQGFDHSSATGILRGKYGAATAWTNAYNTAWAIQTGRRLKDWGWNAYSEGPGTGQWMALGAAISDGGFTTSDHYIPPQFALPIAGEFESYWTGYNINSYASQGVKNMGALVKQGTGFFTSFYSYSQGADVFDPGWTTYFQNAMVNFTNLNHWKNPHNDFLMSFYPDESDNIGWAKAGVDFPTVYANAFETSPSGHQGQHFGWAVLISAPTQTGSYYDYLPQSASSYKTNWVYALDSANHTKQEMANWLCGNGAGCSPTDLTTGATAARSGSTVTMTISSPSASCQFPTGPFTNIHCYIPKELISVDSCSDSSFNTVAGTGVTVTSTTGTTVVFTLAGAGATATGCRMFTGPNYGTLTALNTAWSVGGQSTANYDAWGSDAVSHADTLCAGQWDGVKTSCSWNYVSTPVTPMTTFITINGVNTLGDDGRGVTKVKTGYTAGVGDFTDGNATTKSTTFRGTVTYATGSATVTFATPPPNGATVQAAYLTNGWGAGHGLLDEDNTCPSKTSGSCWMPTDAYAVTGVATSAKFATDVDGFLFHYAKQFYKSIRGVINQNAPGVMLAGMDLIGGWGSPPRRQVLQAASAYADSMGFKQLLPFPDQNGTLGPDPTYGNQPRIDWVAQYFGDHPLVNFNSSNRAGADSSWAPFPDANGSTEPQAVPNTQAGRAAAYRTDMTNFLSIATSAGCNCSFVGTHPFVEYTWLTYYDEPITELKNYGIVSYMDNPYDGRSAGPNAGTDQWGYPTGCTNYPPATPQRTSTTPLIVGDTVVLPSSFGGACYQNKYGGNATGPCPFVKGMSFIINKGQADQEILGVNGIVSGGYYVGNSDTMTVHSNVGHVAGWTLDSNYSPCDGYNGATFGDFLTSASSTNRLWLNYLKRTSATGVMGGTTR